MTSKLALHGGPKTLPSQRPFTLYRLERGLSRSIDLMRMLPLTARGVTSINDGSGIVGRFEQGMCQLTGARHALAMNSGTAALHSAYFAVGVGPGTEVIVPAYTWHASATPVLQCGAVPVFCEVDAETLTIDVDDVERRITERTRAICVVHIWGNPGPMDRLRELCDRHDLALIEDCSHAHGASFKGRAVGAWGDVGCFSLQGSKVVEGGEAGVAVTDDAVLYDRMCLLGHNVMVRRGQRADTFKDFGDVSLGVKYRPHPAAMYLAHASLGRLAKRNLRAARAWNWLCQEVADCPAIRPIGEHPGAVRGGYYAYVFEYTGEALGSADAAGFVEAVRAEGAPIDLDQFRGRLLHTLPVFTSLDRRVLGGGCYDATRPWEENVADVSLPVSEGLADRLVRFPVHLFAMPEAYVRGCGQAMVKAFEALSGSETSRDREAASAAPAGA